MTILNPNCVYYLSDIHGPKSKVIRYDYDPLLWQTFHENNNNQYVVIEFFTANEFADHHLSEIIDQKFIDGIKRKEIYLLLHNSHEAFHWVVEPLYKNLIIPYNLPPEQVILLSESPDIYSVIEKVSGQLLVDKIQAKWINKFQYDIHRENRYLVSKGIIRPRLTNKTYSKKFLNLNRRWRSHRPGLVAALWDKNLLQHGYVSLAKSDDEKSWNNVIPELHLVLQNNSYFNSLFTERVNELKNIPDLKLDDVNLIENQPELTASLDRYYENTYFSVVCETQFFSNDNLDYGRFMSEKTFKPMAYRHPFILTTVPFVLEKLRDIGYQTFHPYINESYDLEVDNAERLYKIVLEIERLCNLNEKELHDFIDHVAPICEHNYDLLMNRSQFIFDLG